MKCLTTLTKINIVLFLAITSLLYIWYQPSEEELRQQRLDKLHPHAIDYFDPMSSPELVQYIHDKLEYDVYNDNDDLDGIENFILHPIFHEYREISENNDEIMDA